MKDQFCLDCINIWPRFSPATEFMVPGLNVVSLGGQLSKSPCYNPQNPRCQQIWFKFATFLAWTSRHIFAGHLPIFVEGFVMFFTCYTLPPQLSEPSGGWFFRNSCDAVAEAHREIVGSGGWIEFGQAKLLSSDHMFYILILLSSFTCWHIIFWLLVPRTN